LSSRSIYLLI